MTGSQRRIPFRCGDVSLVHFRGPGLPVSIKKQVCVLTLLIASAVPLEAAEYTSGPDWNDWSAASFARAKAQKKPVFLYLEAVWCHWCHVMQDKTFSQPGVQKQLAEQFVAIKVDHDADPGLANRYRDYGWPALIFLSPDGLDLVKRAGFIGPGPFSALLTAVAEDPTPEARSAAAPVLEAGPSRLADSGRAYLLRRHEQSFDPDLGGLRIAQKFMDRDGVEYSLQNLAVPGERAKAIKTLDAALALIDPVWGGVYQYSTGGNWQNPHFEKIMRVQAGYLRLYAMAYRQLGDPKYLQAARDIQRYLIEFLRSPEGAFYVSQDADLNPGEKSAAYFALDDAARRKLGMPRVDRHQYADANALAVEALVALYFASGDEQSLAHALRAANWLLNNRRGSGGLMRHSKTSEAAPHLSDSLFTARAALSLYAATAQREWLQLADELGAAIGKIFRDDEAGFVTEIMPTGVPLQPRPHLAENIAAARLFNLLFHYSGKAAHRDSALHAMRFLAAVAAQKQVFEEAGILLADTELRTDPVHLTVVGAKDDENAEALFQVARSAEGSYRRVEWLDRREGDLPHADVTYPAFKRPAGFVCTAGRCSRPSFEPEDYARQIDRLTQGSMDR